MIPLKLIHPWRNATTQEVHDQGARIELDFEQAAGLVAANIAIPATKPAAEELGVDVNLAATADKK